MGQEKSKQVGGTRWNRKRYSEEDTRRILQEALEHQSHERDFSHDQLLEMAEELGISHESLAVAEKKWLGEKKIDEEKYEFERYRRQQFNNHLMSYGIVITFLFFINLLTSPGHFWFLYPLLGWGIAVAFQYAEVRQTAGQKYEDEFEKWRIKQQIKSSTKRLQG